MNDTQRTVQIIHIRDNWYSVKVNGNLVCDQLCEDECLGVVAAFIYRPGKVPYLRTPEADARMKAAINKPDDKDISIF
jgi:hypothetical protein